jgi:hypothetical protein
LAKGLLRWLVVVLAGFNVAVWRRINAQVNVFRKALYQLKALGQGGAALELERPALLLQTPQAVHEPVVFFNQLGVDAPRLTHFAHQIQKIGGIVQKNGGLAGTSRLFSFRHGRPID